MIHVVLDTNIYRHNPHLKSPGFKSLTSLAKRKSICIHIPYVVEQEFSTQLVHDHKKKINSAIDSISHIVNNEKLKGIVTGIEKCLQELQKNKADLYNETKEAFDEWLIEVGAIRHSLSEAEAKRAMDAYFKGEPPLKKVKNRKDIPDSFIFQSIQTLHEKYKHKLHCIIHDNDLRGACQSSGIETHASLDEFITSEKIKKYIENAFINDNIEFISNHLLEYAKREEKTILSQIDFALADYPFIKICDPAIGASKTLSVVDEKMPHSLVLHGGIHYYGEGFFVLRFDALVEFTYDFTIFESDVDKFNNDKYDITIIGGHISAETTDQFKFSGQIEFDYHASFSAIKDKGKSLKALKDPEITVSELFNFEIKEKKT